MKVHLCTILCNIDNVISIYFISILILLNSKGHKNISFIFIILGSVNP